MNVTEAMENYLEAILMLSKNQPEIHATHLCSELGFSRPTVSEMMKQLKKKGLIEVDTDNHIHLTAEGRNIAETTYEKHEILAEMLMTLGVDKKTAYEDACKLEHDLSKKSFECIKRHTELLRELRNNLSNIN
jgi:Mn-dependent DtxR family transcriptional regulator